MALKIDSIVMGFSEFLSSSVFVSQRAVGRAYALEMLPTAMYYLAYRKKVCCCCAGGSCHMRCYCNSFVFKYIQAACAFNLSSCWVFPVEQTSQRLTHHGTLANRNNNNNNMYLHIYIHKHRIHRTQPIQL